MIEYECINISQMIEYKCIKKNYCISFLLFIYIYIYIYESLHLKKIIFCALKLKFKSSVSKK